MRCGSIPRARRLCNRATARLIARDLDAAVQDANAALELDPDDGEALAIRGLAHGFQDNLLAARADLKRATEYDRFTAARPATAILVEARSLFRGSMLRNDADYPAPLAAYWNERSRSTRRTPVRGASSLGSSPLARTTRSETAKRPSATRSWRTN